MARRTWIFQGNPVRFDLRGYLATKPPTYSWLVTRYADEVHVGDEVYIWASKGSGRSDDSGIIASATVLEPPSVREDDTDSIPFWKEGDPTEKAMRVTLRADRLANTKETLKRNYFEEDPILRDLSILKMANATNFRVSESQAARLRSLWSRTGVDWSYPESLAGLRTYITTYGQKLSTLPGSPVADTALLIGRAIGGVYNKVLNFRSLDPRDGRAGLPGASNMDREVWNKFFNSVRQELRIADVEQEFERMWGVGAATDETTPPVPITAEEEVEVEARSLYGLSVEQLRERLSRIIRDRPAKPASRTATTRQFDRLPEVVAIAKKRAGFVCEVAGCAHPLFEGKDGAPYLEVHHIEPLGEGGLDDDKNVVCVCPAHHREAHLGKNAASLKEQFIHLRTVSV